MYSRKYEIAQNNKILYDKLVSINKRDIKYSKLMTPGYISNHRNNEGYIKLGIMNLAQQNLYMLKRLTEKKSEYSVKKMEEDYKKIQNYKKIMCNFPCINFNKKKRGYSSDNKDNINEKREFFPTINYINDGYLDKMGRKIKDKKKKEGNKLVKNLFNNNDDKNNSNHKILEKEDKKELNQNEEHEYEFDKEKIIDISKNDIKDEK